MAMKKSSPVYALVGTESFLQLEALRDIVASLGKSVQRIDVDGDGAALSTVLDELRSYAMFGGSKLVIVRSADPFITAFRSQLEDYAEAPSDSGTLVLRVNALPKTQRIYKFIDKLGGIIPCEPMKPAQLPKWLIDRAKQTHDVKLAPDAASMLAEMIGDDLGKLDMELAKLALMSDDGAIDVKLVGGGVVYQREREMFELTNALATGNATEALRRWRQLVQADSSAEFRATTWLGMWLEDVRSVLVGNAGGLTWKYKENMAKFVTHAKSIGPTGLRRTLDLLAEVDRQSKSGVGNAADNIERFILSTAVRK
jgi:DNA polymerase III subunit delta